MVKAIAIIPARGGSKGLPRKNVLPLAGKPLLAWTIDAAKNAQSVGRVFVSTDDPEIAQIAERYSAEVVWRPASISGDLASSEAALTHVLHSISEPGEPLPEVTVFLQCTSPLTMAEDIDGTVNTLLDADADTAVAVADFHYFLWKDEHETGDFVGINHDKSIRLMRQEREHQFIETGAIYAMKTEGFLIHKHRFFGKTASYVMPEQRVLEIDTMVDFKIAETLLANEEEKNLLSKLPTNVGAVIFDFDGVFTDDHVTLSETGQESVVCSRSDGMGIKLARTSGIRMLVLSTEVNTVVRKRAEKLKLEVIHGVDDKMSVLNDWLCSHEIPWSDVVYVGNDVNDIGCLDRAGCGVVVANAHPHAARHANLVLTRRGGDNAVRELTDLLLQESNNRQR
jgi:YrbI family 3-deoxy-D-manno-octulosonate 8-phosphate phosphatase